MFDILPAPESEIPESDRFEGAPHPRQNLALIGHGEAESAVLDAYRAGRLHHAWLIAGPEGIGKATLAYRIARFLLEHGDPRLPAVQRARDLSVSATSFAARQIAASAHPDLATIRRGLTQNGKALMTELSVDAIRKGLDLFTKTAGSGGYRIAIVDACDDMNASSANALLKTLEEPPAKSLLLLVAHQPGRLLPTIRSRCRLMALRPLTAGQVAEITANLPETAGHGPDLHRRAAERADGSVRKALALLDPKRLAFHESVEALLAGLPRLDRAAVDTLAEQCHGRAGEENFARFCDLCEGWLSRRLAENAGSPADLAPLPELWNKLEQARREIDVYNLDRRPYVFEIAADLATVARRQGSTLRA